ncbi:recombinase family protein [Clostridium butyricum]|uniref:recombinase family protein n=1 Tax=Clostridium butyricum TaxID=1492 RepID=UPI000903D877|nr:recombinase family protein [Clostridium butyricum]APF22074.1 hypothetical protein NPD4_17 [Clostridium butyricum]
MAIYGYTRISTNSKKQDNTRQIKGITDYLKIRKLSTKIKFFNDEITGKKFDRPAFNQLKNEVVAGDEVIIYQLDRLGRKKEGIKEALEWFKKRGVMVRVLDIPTTLQDFAGMDSGLAKTIMDLINNLMIEMAGAFAEAEAERISSRVKEGMAVAKENGKQIGNSKKTVSTLPDNFEYYYNLIKNKTVKKKDVASILGVGEATLWRYCKLYEGQDVYSKNAEDMKKKRSTSNQEVEQEQEQQPKEAEVKIPKSTDWIKTGKKKINQRIKRKWGINIKDIPVALQDLKVIEDDKSIMYDFKYEGARYQVEYLKNSEEIEFAIVK